VVELAVLSGEIGVEGQEGDNIETESVVEGVGEAGHSGGEGWAGGRGVSWVVKRGRGAEARQILKRVADLRAGRDCTYVERTLPEDEM
jgi:hypothetical protein